MAEAAQVDDKILALINTIKTKKSEIAKSERYTYLTNCTFSYNADGTGHQHNMHVLKLEAIIDITAFLIERRKSIAAAIELLNVDKKSTKDEWNGFSFDDWFSDLKARAYKIQLASEKKKLEALEARLNNIVSPQLRAQMELDAITSELG